METNGPYGYHPTVMLFCEESAHSPSLSSLAHLPKDDKLSLANPFRVLVSEQSNQPF